jgi:HEAT repeat protein
MRLKGLLAALGVVILVVALVHGWFYLSGGTRSASPEKLAQQALSEPTVEEKTRAALRLGECGYEARDQLRQVLQQSDTPEVRAACIQGLGAIKDYDSVDLLMDALEDESLIVRGRAGSVLTKMISGAGETWSFKASAPEGERKKAIEILRDHWEQLRDSPLLNQYRRRLQEGRDHET